MGGLSHPMRSSRRVAAAAMLALAAMSMAMPASGACQSFDADDRTTHRWITLDDFQGKPPRYLRLTEDGGLMIHKAQIRVRVEVSDLGVQVVDSASGMTATVAMPCIQTVMYKKESGANASRMDGDDLLHEQLHFDITRHFAGVLSERLTGIEFTSTSEEQLKLGAHARVAEIVASVLAQEQATQERFDKETSKRGSGVALARWRRCTGAPSS